MLNFVESYGFVEHLDPQDYRLLSEQFGVEHLRIPTDGSVRQRLTTLISNTRAAMPTLSHRCSRVPIYTSDVTAPLLESGENRRVFFVICEQDEGGAKGDAEAELRRFSRPRVNLRNEGHNIYVSDLEPVVLTRESPDDEFKYDVAETDSVKAEFKTIFPYNPILAFLEYNNRLNIILKPVMGRGIVNCRWSPAICRYRWLLDPAYNPEKRPIMTILRETSEGEKERPNTLRRKVKGELGAKELFMTDCTTGVRYDIFGSPYGIDLLFEYNGKMGCRDVALRSIDTLRKGIHLFQEQFLKTPVNLDESADQYIGKSMHSDTLTIRIPASTEGKLVTDKSEYRILTDDTIANMLRTKMLEIANELIGDQHDWWSRTAITYKVPHPMIVQCLIIVPLPLHNGDGTENADFMGRITDRYPDAEGDWHTAFIVDACEKLLEDLQELENEL